VDVLARVRDETGVSLQVLPGEDEARYTFLAVRRWYGWSAGRLLVLDIGGGSLELAAGVDELPDISVDYAAGPNATAADGTALAQTTLVWRSVNLVCVLVVRERLAGSPLKDALLIATPQIARQGSATPAPGR